MCRFWLPISLRPNRNTSPASASAVDAGRSRHHGEEVLVVGDVRRTSGAWPRPRRSPVVVQRAARGSTGTGSRCTRRRVGPGKIRLTISAGRRVAGDRDVGEHVVHEAEGARTCRPLLDGDVALLEDRLVGEPDPHVRPVQVVGVAVGDRLGADRVPVQVADVVAVEVAVGGRLPVAARQLGLDVVAIQLVELAASPAPTACRPARRRCRAWRRRSGSRTRHRPARRSGTRSDRRPRARRTPPCPECRPACRPVSYTQE